MHAFSGLTSTIRGNPDIRVMFEWSPDQLRQVGSEPDALVDLLAGLGLNFFLLEDDLHPIDRGSLLDVPYGNVLARR